jgi:hypothetical protein
MVRAGNTRHSWAAYTIRHNCLSHRAISFKLFSELTHKRWAVIAAQDHVLHVQYNVQCTMYKILSNLITFGSPFPAFSRLFANYIFTKFVLYMYILGGFVAAAAAVFWATDKLARFEHRVKPQIAIRTLQNLTGPPDS